MKEASANPWGGITLEWTIPSPPIHENFEKIPVVEKEPYDYTHYEEIEEVKN